MSGNGFGGSWLLIRLHISGIETEGTGVHLQIGLDAWHAIDTGQLMELEPFSFDVELIRHSCSVIIFFSSRKWWMPAPFKSEF